MLPSTKDKYCFEQCFQLYKDTYKELEVTVNAFESLPDVVKNVCVEKLFQNLRRLGVSSLTELADVWCVAQVQDLPELPSGEKRRYAKKYTQLIRLGKTDNLLWYCVRLILLLSYHQVILKYEPDPNNLNQIIPNNQIIVPQRFVKHVDQCLRDETTTPREFVGTFRTYFVVDV